MYIFGSLILNFFFEFLLIFLYFQMKLLSFELNFFDLLSKLIRNASSSRTEKKKFTHVRDFLSSWMHLTALWVMLV